MESGTIDISQEHLGRHVNGQGTEEYGQMRWAKCSAWTRWSREWISVLYAHDSL